MAFVFEELAVCPTRMGELVLRKRSVPELKDELVYEVKLGEDFLMSSLFTVAEIALADLGLAALDGTNWDVAVGGLGLGYTAAAALKHEGVNTLAVIDGLAEVIDWHQRHLVPLGEELSNDPRCRFVHGDFFALSARSELAPDKLHAVLLDVDHAPDKLLDPSHAPFYEVEGLRNLADQLHPGGVFALWSNDPPDAAFVQRLESVFTRVEAHPVPFFNPLRGCEESNSVYVAVTGLQP